MALYANLHGRIDEIERRVNERLKGMTMLDLSRFEAALDNVRDDNTTLKGSQTLTFSVPTDTDSKKEKEVLYDITGKPVDKKKKGKRIRSESE